MLLVHGLRWPSMPEISKIPAVAVRPGMAAYAGQIRWPRSTCVVGR